MSWRNAATATLLAVGLSGVAAAAGSDSGSVSVSVAPPTVTVRVDAATDLRSVLRALCDAAEADCVLTAAMRHVTVSPGTRKGSWVEVVSSLLEGSGLSFAATPAVPGRQAKLLVEAVQDVKDPGGRNAAVPSGRAGSSGVDAASLDAQPIEPVEQPASEEEAAQVDITAPLMGTDPGSLVSLDPAAGAVPGTDLAMTPFADGGGRPLLQRLPPRDGSSGPGGGPPGVATLPYSEPDGTPITVPITNEPLTLTPFAGPDGEPWPAPPPEPNQKLQYPIPANVGKKTTPESK